MIERYGADMRLPDLREEIAQCSRQCKMHDGCMVRYVDLIPKAVVGECRPESAPCINDRSFTFADHSARAACKAKGESY